jgi:hypothetical protein
VGAAALAWPSERLCNGPQHSLRIGKDFVVPEPENAPASPPQLAVAQFMVAGPRMLTAIGFDDQARFNAGEIDDVGRDWKLASKAPAQPVFAELFPQHLLGIWHISTERARFFLY